MKPIDRIKELAKEAANLMTQGYAPSEVMKSPKIKDAVFRQRARQKAANQRRKLRRKARAGATPKA